MTLHEGGPAFPSVELEGPTEQPTGRIHWHGVSKAELFAAFALAGMLGFDDTDRVENTVEAAVRYGRAMVEEFDRKPEEEEPPEDEAAGMDPRDATLEHLLDVANATDNDLIFHNVRKEIERRIREAREAGIAATREPVRREFVKIRDEKGELEADAALETLRRWWSGAIPVPLAEEES